MHHADEPTPQEPASVSDGAPTAPALAAAPTAATPENQTAPDDALAAAPTRGPTAPTGASGATTPAGVPVPAARPALAAAAPAAPIRVLVIDDELAGMTAAHLNSFADAFVAQLEDVNSPTCAAVWGIVAALTGKPAFEAMDIDAISAYYASDDFVRDVVLSNALRNAELPEHGLLTRFYAQERIVSDLRGLLEKAYAAPRFTLTFEAARPAAPAHLRGFDLVILDLVLANSADAVDDLVKYLKVLATDVTPLPCFIVLSSREEMIDNRPRFSSEASISAAGLLLLEKRHVRHTQFGATGLLLSYEQLARQRDVAQKIRLFVRAWIEGLDNARRDAAQTLWNLDAAAMQEIHLSASSDDDPYDAHLNELVSREYLWHVEGAAPVVQAIEALDQAFQAHVALVDGKPAIAERFVAPYADPKPGRTLASHYNWTGFAPTGRLDAIAETDIVAKFNRLVPFGAVLAPETLQEGSECWVHITQQCDLNAVVRPPKPNDPPDGKVSATFAIATAHIVSDRRLPSWDTRDVVAKGMRVGEQEFDLKLVSGRLLSLPVKPFVKMAREDKRQVVGRLRHDVATHFLSATTNHMTRAAQLKATRVVVRPAQVYLWGNGINANRPLSLLTADGNEPREIQVGVDNSKYYLADDASLWVALWLTDLARNQLNKTVEPFKVYNVLRGGMRKNATVVSVIKLSVMERAFARVNEAWQAALPNEPTLVLVMEPPTATG